MADQHAITSAEQNLHSEEDPVFVTDNAFSDIPDFMHQGHPGAGKIPDNLTLDAGNISRFWMMAVSFVLMLEEWIKDFQHENPYSFENHPCSYFFQFFLRRTYTGTIADFFAAQPSDICKYLPRISPTMIASGGYVDVILNVLTGFYSIYCGSATGIGGLWHRFKEYCRPASAGSIKHHVQLWLPDWIPSFHQIFDLSVLASYHRVYTIAAESFSIVLTDSFDIAAPNGPYNAPGSAEFIRKFQRKWDIPIRSNVLPLNRALPFRQPVVFDKRFLAIQCCRCQTVEGPFTTAIPGALYDLNNVSCHTCHYRLRPDIPFCDEYSFWLIANGDRCMCCHEQFSDHSNEARYIPEIRLRLCRGCQRNWDNNFILPIEGIHIPVDHVWACELCETTQSQWFGFEVTGAHYSHFHCYDCRVSLGADASTSLNSARVWKSKNKNKPKRYASYPYDILSMSGVAGRDYKRAFRAWLLRIYSIDLDSPETCIKQRAIDLGLVEIQTTEM